MKSNQAPKDGPKENPNEKLRNWLNPATDKVFERMDKLAKEGDEKLAELIGLNEEELVPALNEISKEKIEDANKNVRDTAKHLVRLTMQESGSFTIEGHISNIEKMLEAVKERWENTTS